MKKTYFILLILNCSLLIACLPSGTAFAQVTEDWVSRYNGPGNANDRAYSIAVDGSGNVYVTGTSLGSGTNHDFATIKYNSSGLVQWAARYNGPANSSDEAYSIAVDGSGNVYVTGWSNGTGTGQDYATIKYNSSGVQLWAARYNGPGNFNDLAFSIAVDASGNVYVTGASLGSGTNDDFATIKYNSSGLVQWAARYNGPANGNDRARSLAVDGSGNVYVTGSSTVTGIFDDFVTIKYNYSGVQQWVQTYNGPGNGSDYARSLAVDGTGNVYVTGESQGSGTDFDYATIKYNSTGVQQWIARYNGTGNSFDKPYSIAVDASGNVFVTGESFGSGTSFDYATIKYSPGGIQQWVTRYNGTGNDGDHGFSIALDGSGNVYVAGASTGIGTFEDDAIVKYNSSGVQQWVQTYNGPGNSNDLAMSIAVDASGCVYVTGYSAGSGTGNDYTTIKYSQPIGITPISNQIPETFLLEQNYPNPFNPSTKIRFALPKSSFAKLVVYNILGREMETIVNEQLTAGTYEADLDCTNYPSGVYFYKLITMPDGRQAGEYSETKKMVLVK